MSDVYEVYALRYASYAGRQRRESLLRADPHLDGPMPIDFYIWVARNAARTIVIDTGFSTAEGLRRGRTITREPSACLALIGVDAAAIKDVIITHLHFDHAGTIGDFPNAKFHLQEAEMAYATGRYMCHSQCTHAYSPEIVCDMVRTVFQGRVAYHDGDAEIAPNISVHRVGGHTAGLQVVRIMTRRGWLVLASDASHFYENMETANPFPILHNMGDMYEGYRRLKELSGGSTMIIPGHDPRVMQRYPAYQPGLEDIAVRLDADPLTTQEAATC